MNPFNEILYNENIKRQIYLNRNKKSITNSMLSNLRKHDLEFAEKFTSSFSRLSLIDLKKLAQATRFNTDRLKDFKSVLESLKNSSIKSVNDSINDKLDQLTIDEYDFQYNLIQFAKRETDFDVPRINKATKTSLKEYRRLEPMDATTQDDYLEEWGRRRVGKVLQVVRRGLKRGDNKEKIFKAVFGTEKRFSGILKGTHLGASLASDTLHVSATSAANFAFVELNDSFDLLVSAVLDSGSSKQCVLNHNKFVFKDLNGRRAPYHYKCNTRNFPFLKGDESPQKESFIAWWKRQTDAVRRRFLGPTRFAAQNNTPRKLADPRIFISPQKGDFINLEELRDSGVLK